MNTVRRAGATAFVSLNCEPAAPARFASLTRGALPPQDAQMRKRMAALALLVGLVLGGRAGAAELTLVRGGAALATYQQTSADGCVSIHGEIAVVEATRGGELANGLYVTAIREDSCTPDNGNGYAGYAEGSFQVVGLQLGHFAGTAVIPSYSGAA